MCGDATHCQAVRKPFVVSFAPCPHVPFGRPTAHPASPYEPPPYDQFCRCELAHFPSEFTSTSIYVFLGTPTGLLPHLMKAFCRCELGAGAASSHLQKRRFARVRQLGFCRSWGNKWCRCELWPSYGHRRTPHKSSVCLPETGRALGISLMGAPLLDCLPHMPKRLLWTSISC